LQVHEMRRRIHRFRAQSGLAGSTSAM
jgi:hypothetical protein